MGMLAEDDLLDARDEIYINGRREVWQNMEGLI